MFWSKTKKDAKRAKDQKIKAIDEELRVANDIISRFSKWSGNERREKTDEDDGYAGLERRHSHA